MDAKVLVPDDFGSEFKFGTVISGKVTMDWAIKANIQSGTGTSTPIDPATLKAAFGSTVSWPCFINVTNSRAIFAKNDSSFDAIVGFSIGASSGSGVYGAASGTGSGSGVYGVADGTGGGSGVLGLINGPGAGSGVYGAVNGNSNGNGLIGRVDGSGLGSGALLIVNGNGNGDGARSKVNGAGTGSGISAAVYGAGNGHGATLSVGARDTSQPGLPNPAGTGYALLANSGTYGTRLTVAGFYRAGADVAYTIHTNGDIYTTAGMTALGTVTAASFITTSDKRLKRVINEIPGKAAIEYSRHLRFVDFIKLMPVEAAKSEYERKCVEWERNVEAAKFELSQAEVEEGQNFEAEAEPAITEIARGKSGSKDKKQVRHEAPRVPRATAADIKRGLEFLEKERPAGPNFDDETLKIAKQAGVIAQEVAKLSKELGYGEWLVQTGADGYLHVDMLSLMAIVARGNQLRLEMPERVMK